MEGNRRSFPMMEGVRFSRCATTASTAPICLARSRSRTWNAFKGKLCADRQLLTTSRARPIRRTFAPPPFPASILPARSTSPRVADGTAHFDGVTALPTLPTRAWLRAPEARV